MAGNPLIISPDRLKDEGLLAEDEADLPAFPVEKVDFEQVVQTKIPLLKKPARTLKPTLHLCSKGICGFCETKAYWLDDYALFMGMQVLAGILENGKSSTKL